MLSLANVVPSIQLTKPKPQLWWPLRGADKILSAWAPAGMGKGHLLLELLSCKVLFVLQMSEVSVDELLMHYFEQVSSASVSKAPRLSPGPRSWTLLWSSVLQTPSLPTPGKYPAGAHDCKYSSVHQLCTVVSTLIRAFSQVNYRDCCKCFFRFWGFVYFSRLHTFCIMVRLIGLMHRCKTFYVFYSCHVFLLF